MELTSAFLVGLLGGGHCIGMCGGVISALMFATKGQKRWPLLMGYNLGRILSYMLAGAIMASLGQIVFSQMKLPMAGLKLLSGIMMILMALSLAKIGNTLLWLEKAGSHIWKRLQPLSRRFFPVTGFGQALGYGAVWGWLPCGLVYTTLTWSLSAGSAAQGALTMLAFGLGTLPMLLLLGSTAESVKIYLQQPLVRRICALFILGFGVKVVYQSVQLLIQ